VTLLGICFTVFTFLIAINQEILKNNIFISLQIVCAIPFFMTSLLAKIKGSRMIGENIWDSLGYQTYILGYAFLINVVGIFLISFISLLAGIIFFFINIVLAIVYSYVEVYYNKKRLKERIIKDLEFLIIIIFLGILPALGAY
jgi:hypothetical protein